MQQFSLPKKKFKFGTKTYIAIIGLSLVLVGLVIYAGTRKSDEPTVTPAVQTIEGSQPAVAWPPGYPKELPVAVPSDGTDKGEFLSKHNELRAKHGAPPLTWDPVLADFAQKWADKMASENNFGHSSPSERKKVGEQIGVGQAGENLAWSSAGQNGPAKSVQNWYDECEIYDPADPENKNKRLLPKTNQPDVGHYTQVVWKAAKKLGCGVSKNRKYISCNYDIGNFTMINPGEGRDAAVIRSYKENVLPNKSTGKYC